MKVVQSAVLVTESSPPTQTEKEDETNHLDTENELPPIEEDDMDSEESSDESE